jgi:GT2 family glycosyltransferase
VALHAAGDPPHISVSVAVYRSHHAPNLASLAEQLPQALAGLEGELLVTLNGITPAAGRVPPHARVTQFPVNRGVSVGWNAAAALGSAPIVCVVNDDVSLGPGSLRMLHDALMSDGVGVVGPVGTRWDIPRAHHRAYVDLSSSPQGELQECEVVSGFLFATHRHVLEQLGGFDEAYTPCSFEEVDYCTAVRFRLGLKCCAVAGVPFEHDFGISAARPWRRVSYDGRSESLGSIARRNRRQFLAKWSAASEGGTDNARRS